MRSHWVNLSEVFKKYLRTDNGANPWPCINNTYHNLFLDCFFCCYFDPVTKLFVFCRAKMRRLILDFTQIFRIKHWAYVSKNIFFRFPLPSTRVIWRIEPLNNNFAISTWPTREKRHDVCPNLTGRYRWNRLNNIMMTEVKTGLWSAKVSFSEGVLGKISWVA